MHEDVRALYLESARARFRGSKELGDRTLAQLADEDIFWQPNTETNSIALIVKHLRGNMHSRWTNTLKTDGEKPDRDRDSEFEHGGLPNRDAVIAVWEEGWNDLLGAMDRFVPEDLAKSIRIRGEELSLLDGINRQLLHVSYHVGQMVHIGKERLGKRWQTLSIARGESAAYRPQVRLG
jgi:hypothetical protein